MTATRIDTSRTPADAQASYPRTRTWLTCAVIAGPLFLGASLAQALTRQGFHLTKEPVERGCSLGSLGWLQDLNFALAGLLSLAGAVGIHRAITSGVGRNWIRASSAWSASDSPRRRCSIPIRAAASTRNAVGSVGHSDWHGIMHMVCGSAAFLALISTCFVFGRRFSRAGERLWALGARASAVLSAVALTMIRRPRRARSPIRGRIHWMALRRDLHCPQHPPARSAERQPRNSLTDNGSNQRDRSQQCRTTCRKGSFRRWHGNRLRAERSGTPLVFVDGAICSRTMGPGSPWRRRYRTPSPPTSTIGAVVAAARTRCHTIPNARSRT